MYSVTGIIKLVKQPRYGYIPTKLFKEVQLDDISVLNERENIHASLVGLAVDYLTRFVILSGNRFRLKTNVVDAFQISLTGAKLVGEDNFAYSLCSRIVQEYDVYGLNDVVVDCACKLVGFDSAFRAGPMAYREVRDICPNRDTIENIITMVKRSIRFFKTYGPVVREGMVFNGGYSDIVSSGDADFMTKDCLWDFKVSKSKLNSKITLQLGLYYVLGLRSNESNIYKSLKYLGVYNPRLNKVFRASIEDILNFNKDVFSNINNNIILGKSIS